MIGRGALSIVLVCFSEQAEDLEEGEIAASGDSGTQRSGSWIRGGEEVEEVEEEQVIQPPPRKKKRTKRHRSQAFGNISKTVDVFSAVPLHFAPSVQYPGQGILQGPGFIGHTGAEEMYFERPGQWGPFANQRHALLPGLEEIMPELPLNPRPRMMFKHSWSNGYQEPLQDMYEAADPRNMKGVLPLTGVQSWGSVGGRMPESTQKKVCLMTAVCDM